MKSNYKRIGDYVRPVNIRNSELAVSNLLGINIDKFFMPSVANIVGTDMTSYKIVKRNQFACNRMHVGRDKRLPVALSNYSEDFIVSPAYDVFEIMDTEVLLPEYLMMWFSRKEYDRNAWFYTDADVRGGLNWNSFCDMKLPIPKPKKQIEIVKEYHVIIDRININNRLIQKLEETAQAIYKQWFVDFEFPDENGKPYKSNGGEMINSELGDIPKGWRIGNLKQISISTIGGDWGKDERIDNYDARVLCIRGTDIPNASIGKKNSLPVRFIFSKNEKSRKLETNNIVIELSGGSPSQSTGRTVLLNEEYLKYIGNSLICSNFCRIIKAQEGYHHYFFSILNYLYNNAVFFRYENSSNGVKNLDLDSIFIEERILIPNNSVLENFSNFLNVLKKNIVTLGREIETLDNLESILLSKLAIIEE
jgi:type I restriction enzyme, S subunit